MYLPDIMRCEQLCKDAEWCMKRGIGWQVHLIDTEKMETIISHWLTRQNTPLKMYSEQIAMASDK